MTCRCRLIVCGRRHTRSLRIAAQRSPTLIFPSCGNAPLGAAGAAESPMLPPSPIRAAIGPAVGTGPSGSRMKHGVATRASSIMITSLKFAANTRARMRPRRDLIHRHHLVKSVERHATCPAAAAAAAAATAAPVIHRRSRSLSRRRTPLPLSPSFVRCRATRIRVLRRCIPDS